MSKGDLTPGEERLNEVMDFDTVIQVHDDQSVTVHHQVYGPDLDDGELSFKRRGVWSLMSGYSGQHGYSGPIMHASELIGGGMARDILAKPGFYVALVDYASEYEGDDNINGWAVAYAETLEEVQQ